MTEREQDLRKRFSSWATAQEQQALLEAWNAIQEKDHNQADWWEGQWLAWVLRGGKKRRAQGMRWLHHHYSAPIRAYLSKRLEETIAEDLSSQTLLIAIENLMDQKFRIGQPLLPYLYGIAGNLLRHHHRQVATQQQHNSRLAAGDQGETMDALYLATEQRQAIATLLGKLDDGCQQVLQRWMMHMSMKEIAAEFGYRNEAVARNIKRRCFKRLLSILDEEPALYQWLTELR